MTEDEAKPYAKPIPYWVPDTRTVIVCWMMVSSFGIITMCWWKPPSGADSQLLNTLIGMYVGTGFISAVNWWMGSAKGSDANNKMQEKMSEAVAANAGASIPVASPAAVASWWSLLSLAEQATMEQVAVNDQEVQTVLTAFKSGKADDPHLAVLVKKGLLTQARADEIKPK